MKNKICKKKLVKKEKNRIFKKKKTRKNYPTIISERYSFSDAETTTNLSSFAYANV